MGTSVSIGSLELLFLATISTVVLGIFVRVAQRLQTIRNRRRYLVCGKGSKDFNSNFLAFKTKQNDGLSVLAVLGSGGHTAEMLSLISDLVSNTECDMDVTYAYGATDSHSQIKAVKVHGVNELSLKTNKVKTHFEKLPRAREVGQPWISSVWTSLKTTIAALQMTIRVRPHVVLTNGPGTATIIGAVAFGLGSLWPSRFSCRVVYVESFARVETLSLSGKIMYLFADRFLVQWPQLQTRWPLSECYGRLC